MKNISKKKLQQINGGKSIATGPFYIAKKIAEGITWLFS